MAKVAERAGLSRSNIAIWVVYWGEAPSRKTYLEICAVHDLEWDSALENIFIDPVLIFQNRQIRIPALSGNNTPPACTLLHLC